MNTSMEDVAGADFDRSVHSAVINNSQNLVKTSCDRGCVVTKLKQVGRLSIHNVVFAREKSANQRPVR